MLLPARARGVCVSGHAADDDISLCAALHGWCSTRIPLKRTQTRRANLRVSFICSTIANTCTGHQARVQQYVCAATDRRQAQKSSCHCSSYWHSYVFVLPAACSEPNAYRLCYCRAFSHRWCCDLCRSRAKVMCTVGCRHQIFAPPS